MSMNMSYQAAATGSVGARIIGNVPIIADIDVAPPRAREEVIMASPAGYIWSPGFWHWTGHKHVWVAGRNIPGRNDHRWVADHWEQRGSRWRYEPGHWIFCVAVGS